MDYTSAAEVLFYLLRPIGGSGGKKDTLKHSVPVKSE